MVHSLVERNAPFEVEFAGWRSDSWTLHRCGWKIAIENRPDGGFYGNEVAVILHHEEARLSMAGLGSVRNFRMIDRFNQTPDIVRISRVSQKGGVPIYFTTGSGHLNFRWVDAEPKMMEISHHELYSLPLFMELNKPAAQELIVAPDQVGQILEMIHKAQAPGQEAIRERNRLRAQREERESMRLHAHILSLAA